MLRSPLVKGLVIALLLTACTPTMRLAPVIDQYERVIYMEPDEVARECWQRGGRGFGILGCHDEAANVIIVPFPHRVGAAAYRQIRNEEECHRLGWAADHSGARPKGCK